MAAQHPLVWVHGDWLDPRGPALSTYPASPSLFIFDDAVLNDYQLTAKRLTFIYECLLEIPGIHIRRGDPVTQLAAAVSEFSADRIVTTWSVAPKFNAVIDELSTKYSIATEVLAQPAFVTLDKDEDSNLDLKRFSRYWYAISKRAMNPNY